MVLDLSPSAISSYERGEKTPPVETLSRIAALGDVSLDWLINGEESSTDQGKKEEVPREETPVEHVVREHLERFGQTGQPITDSEKRFVAMLRRLKPGVREDILGTLANEYFKEIEREEFGE